MTRTIGAAVGAVIFVLFLSILATRLMGPAPSAGSSARARSISQR